MILQDTKYKVILKRQHDLRTLAAVSLHLEPQILSCMLHCQGLKYVAAS